MTPSIEQLENYLSRLTDFPTEDFDRWAFSDLVREGLNLGVEGDFSRPGYNMGSVARWACGIALPRQHCRGELAWMIHSVKQQLENLQQKEPQHDH
jgi:hypothetical protein